MIVHEPDNKVLAMSNVYASVYAAWIARGYDHQEADQRATRAVRAFLSMEV